ncbi:MAG TPA: hypothetical protein VFQ68_05835 [Streptosporangiaceae bacterium]|nr:hypothetical protein [Streptosporangiaceae bacterium]
MSRHRAGRPASRFPAACPIPVATMLAAPVASRPGCSRHLPSSSRVIAPCRASAAMTSVTVNAEGFSRVEARVAACPVGGRQADAVQAAQQQP